MIEPRLASGVLISAIKRMVEAEGDFATVLKKGDAVSGAILLIGQVRGADPIGRPDEVQGAACAGPEALEQERWPLAQERPAPKAPTPICGRRPRKK